MIHKLLEKWFETMLYIGLMLGLIGFFCFYWKEEYSFRHTKTVLQEFLEETSISGKLTYEEYSGLKKRLHEICPEGTLEISCYKYSSRAIHDLISKEKWEADFTARNVKKTVLFQEYEPQVRQQKESQLRLQKETNASILAADKQEYLPLPQEENRIFISAVREVQEVYEGEELITLCRVIDSGQMYYKEAQDRKATESGEVLLTLTLESGIYSVPVNVICYPRTELCAMGHRVVNTKEVLEEKKLSGKIKCPYCQVIPADIFCSTPVLYVKTGETIQRIGVNILVIYLDGSTEHVTPEAEEWQDDFDENYCGTQMTVIRYRNKETMIKVISENPLCKKCGGSCNDRCYEDYVRYPYCVECLSKIYVYTGENREEEELITKKELLYKLDTEGEFLLNRGDFIMVTYKQGKNITILQQKVKINGSSGKE